jgi:hypothetical protein
MEQRDHQPREAYEAPAVTVIGTVEGLTLGGFGSRPDSFYSCSGGGFDPCMVE